jgi:Na+/H+-dicarboxylate symporter
MSGLVVLIVAIDLATDQGRAMADMMVNAFGALGIDDSRGQ